MPQVVPNKREPQGRPWPWGFFARGQVRQPSSRGLIYISLGRVAVGGTDLVAVGNRIGVIFSQQ
jgi:hypothetical protein